MVRQRNLPAVRSLEAAASVAATAVAGSPAAEVAPQTSATEPAKTSTTAEAASSAADSDIASGPATEQGEGSQPGARSEGEPVPQSDVAAAPRELEEYAAEASAAGGMLNEGEQAAAHGADSKQPAGKQTDSVEEQAEGSGLPGAAEASKGDEGQAGVSKGDGEGDGADVSGVDLTGSAGIADEEQLLPALMRQVSPASPVMPVWVRT